MIAAISNSFIGDTLRPYGLALEPGIADKIRAYISLLLKWNKKLSLTTVENPEEILKFHFGESIFAASIANFEKSRLADVGSGAGFPGLPLAIIVPSLNVTLIESNGKKCAVPDEPRLADATKSSRPSCEEKRTGHGAASGSVARASANCAASRSTN